jgi:hypothetical protein
LIDEWRLVEDDDGHSYVIPADQLEDFEDWVDNVTNGCAYLMEKDYEQYYLNTHPTSVVFKDWRIEQHG